MDKLTPRQRQNPLAPSNVDLDRLHLTAADCYLGALPPPVLRALELQALLEAPQARRPTPRRQLAACA